MEIDKVKVFERAAEIAKERGWGNGNQSMGYQDGPVCILGACRLALDEIYPGTISQNVQLPYDELKALSFWGSLGEVTGYRAPYDWNDDLEEREGPTRTEQLVSMLKMAAENEASKLAST